MNPLPFKLRQETDLEKWRADTFWEKEPETIAWIKSFKAGDTFLDIGANIGIYTLYAARKRVKTLALEPHPGNFHALAINCRQLNRWMPIRFMLGGAGDKDGCTDLYFDNKTAGATGDGKNGKIRQVVRIYTIDFLTEHYGPFTHIKIDVDGGEADIVRGMKRSLAEQAFKTCLVEVAPRTKEYIVSQFESNDYTRDNVLNTMTPHSRERRAQEGIDVENIVFTRGG